MSEGHPAVASLGGRHRIDRLFLAKTGWFVAMLGAMVGRA
jgi:hypothetical protein